MRPFSLLRRPAQSVTRAQSRRVRLRKLLCESLEQRALMAVFSVQNLNDSGPGSLREIVALAQSNEDFSDEINFDGIDFVELGPQTLTLASEIAITENLTILGPGSDTLAISGNNSTRLFSVQELGTSEIFVSLQGMTLTGGNADQGGALRNDLASVTLVDVAVTGNTSTGHGGAIYTRGETENIGTATRFTLVLIDSLVTGNTAGGSGGGIYNDKDHVEIYNSVIENNQATLDGGGIFTEGNPSFNNEIGTLYFRDRSLLNNNRALRNGGGIFAINDHVEVFNSTVSNNTAGVNGGGIYTSATDFFFLNDIQPSTLWISQGTISNNRALNGTGGGIHNNSDTLDIFRSTIDGNQAAEGGGIYIENPAGNFVNNYISNSTVSNNVATGTGAFLGGGGLAYRGSPIGSEVGVYINAYNSTFSGNRTDDKGGAIYIGQLGSSDRLELNAVTIANNRAVEGGGIYHDDTSSEFQNEILIQSSLIATNIATTAPDLRGSYLFNSEVFSQWNLIGNGDGATGLVASANLIGTTESPIDPLIGPLQDNGGGTKTHALLANSPAIDASDYGLFFDQRDVQRIESFETPIDIGAYERAFDFGDAPSTFPTTLANNGARHVVSNLYLGSFIDSDGNGVPSGAGFASADDVSDFSDDEDGVLFTFSSTAGFTGSAQVTSSGPGVINAWLDVNGNGTWDTTEQILTDKPVVAGANLLTFNIPAPPAGSPVSFTAVARFRLSTATGLQPTGVAEDGEVEDYAMTITRVILPDGTNGAGYTFTERVPPRIRRPYDPELAYGYDYETNPANATTPAGDKFTEVELLPGFGDDGFSIHLFNTATGKYETDPLTTVTAPAIINFETGLIVDALGTRPNAFTSIPGGVNKFRLLGIELSEQLDPNNPAAFPTFLAFGDADNNNESIVNFTMIPLATPVAQAETYSVLEDNTLVVPASGLLSNDTDRNADPLTAVVLNNPSNGTLTLAANGGFSYQPNANFNGSDVFTYRAFDGLQFSDPVSVTISVISVNDAPAGTDALVTILEDSSKTFAPGDFGLTDPSDSPANALQAIIVDALPAAGSLALGGSPVSPAQEISASDIPNLVFTPAANANGDAYASFTFRVRDNGGTTDGGLDTDATANTISIRVTPVNDAPAFTGGGDQSVLEDVGETLVIGWATNLSAGPSDESGQTLSFEVTNNNNSLFSVQPVVNADGSLRFTPAPNAYGSAIVSVLIKDNGGTANGGVDSSAVQTFAIEIARVNDAPTFVAGANASALEDSPIQTVPGWATLITTGAANESQALTFLVTNSNTELFSLQPTIAADGTLSFTPAANAFGQAVVSVQLKDDGGVANSGVDTSAVQTFTINIISVNDAPDFVAGPNQTVLEDSGAQTVTGWATGITPGPANESSQTTTFSIGSNSNTALFAVQPAVASDGTLTYTPAANANGSATVVVRLVDNGGTTFGGVNSVEKTLTISVTPVNDAPTFTKGSNLTVTANAGAQSVVGWASNILPGPPNESTQSVNFLVSNSNNALFSVQPTIASNGTLNFTPAATGNGTATVTVLLRDNAGTANGGVDTSVAQTFTITVNPAATNNRPTASIAGPTSVVRGQSVAFTLTANDVDPGDNAAGFAFIINWGDGSPQQVLPAGTPSGTVVNRTFAANGRFTVSVTAKDRTGLSSTAATRVVTVGAILQQGNTLVIGGTTGNDSIDVFNLVGTRAVINGTWYGPFSGITNIQVFAQAGNDCIDIDSNITVPVLVDGGAGDDKIEGGSGNDTLLGGLGRDCIEGGKGNDFIDGGADNDTIEGEEGNDIILGGSGNDTLYGDSGRDLLIGGLGADWLYGGSDDDVLIGGTTSYDNDRTELEAVMLEWTRTTANYTTRLARLRDGATGGLNGTYRLNTTTVQKDSQLDQLFGESGTDWFFAFNNATTGDRVRDKASSETVTNLS